MGRQLPFSGTAASQLAGSIRCLVDRLDAWVLCCSEISGGDSAPSWCQKLSDVRVRQFEATVVAIFPVFVWMTPILSIYGGLHGFETSPLQEQKNETKISPLQILMDPCTHTIATAIAVAIAFHYLQATLPYPMNRYRLKHWVYLQSLRSIHLGWPGGSG